MINYTIFMAVNLFSILCFVLTYNALFIQKKENPIKNWNIAFAVMAVSLMAGIIAFDWSLKQLFLLILIGFSINQILLLKRNVQPIYSLGLQLAVYAVLLWLPLEKIPFPEDFFFNLDSLLFLVASILTLLLYHVIKKTDFKEKLASPVAMIGLSAVIVFLTPPDYSLFIMTVLFALTGSYHVKLVTEENLVYENEMSLKIKRLEQEFNEEVRKAVNRHTFHLKEVQEKMSHINKIDNLTKAYNKKAIFNIIDDLTQDRRVPLFSIIMFDIDHFKTLNDTLGHVQGDICLKSLASIAFECIRDTDYFGRYGGDEFLIVLPKADIETAKLIADRFRQKVDKETSPHFTLSLGLANFPADGDHLKPLLDIADKGLYVSKEKGRNRVSYYSPQL